MRKFTLLMSIFSFILTSYQTAFAETSGPTGTAISPTGATGAAAPVPKPAQPLVSFTGKITRNKVRMRLQPNLDSNIVRELNQDDIVLVLGDSDEFYAVEPPSDVKAYIYRTFVLDGVVEGNHVNIRLEPDLASPIIAQLNSGDPVNGTVLPNDKKWMEIAPPSSARFYVSKEYVQKVGEGNMFSTLLKKARDAKIQQEIASALNNGNQSTLASANPPTPATPPTAAPNPASQAPAAKHVTTPVQQGQTTIPAQTTTPTQPLQPIQQTPQTATPVNPNATKVSMNSKMAQWQETEQRLFEGWIASNDQTSSLDDFYDDQAQHAVTLQGIIEPYHRQVKNKPGDYVLVSSSSHLPIAYLYSTHVNLQEDVGHEVVIHAIPRDNHNFAYPAYFVISAN